MASTANGSPTKAFFISMLTRDIVLEDAILDLLDNCLDGVVRQKKSQDKSIADDYYKGFSARITIAKDLFCIEDNCGGIPRDKAENYAFRMGKEPGTADDSLPTVGIYGIGMKRAIFKIGKEANVTSQHPEGSFSVLIPEGWINEEKWTFPIYDEAEKILGRFGTTISITKLTENVASQFSDDRRKAFVESLIGFIKSSYSLIIEKGFEIFVNDEKVAPINLDLYVSEERSSIAPFMFKKKYDDVEVSLAVGFYQPPPTDLELDESNESKRSTDDAGWTIVCNDRVILYNDKSHLTGWGEAGVPKYHTQFIGIRGVVFFESNNPEMLPMTTTKRGIDLSSPIYADVKQRMREGLKKFTNYTNQWKGRSEQERQNYSRATKVSATALLKGEYAKRFEARFNPTRNDGHLFNPDLPAPPIDRKYETIRFTRAKEEVAKIRSFFTEGDESIDMSPSEVGENCFVDVLKRITGEE